MKNLSVIVMSLGFFGICIGAVIGLFGIAAMDKDLIGGIAGMGLGFVIATLSAIAAFGGYLLIPPRSLREDPVFESLVLTFAGIGNTTSLAGMIFYFIPFVKGDNFGAILFVFFCALGYASVATEYRILRRFPNIRSTH